MLTQGMIKRLNELDPYLIQQFELELGNYLEQTAAASAQTAAVLANERGGDGLLALKSELPAPPAAPTVEVYHQSKVVDLQPGTGPHSAAYHLNYRFPPNLTNNELLYFSCQWQYTKMGTVEEDFLYADWSAPHTLPNSVHGEFYNPEFLLHVKGVVFPLMKPNGDLSFGGIREIVSLDGSSTPSRYVSGITTPDRVAGVRDFFSENLLSWENPVDFPLIYLDLYVEDSYRMVRHETWYRVKGN